MWLLPLTLACTKEPAIVDTHQEPDEPALPVFSFIDAAGSAGLVPCSAVYGFALGDFDRDTRVDLAMSCGTDEPLRLFHNQSGHFTDGTADLPQLFDPRYIDRRVPAFGDIDGDGDLGLFVPTGSQNGEGEGIDQLYRNDGDGWSDIAATLGVEDPFGGGRYALWLDVDGDTDDDLFVGHRVYTDDPARDHHTLFLNGPWTDASDDWALHTSSSSSGAGLAADWDGDGRVDLLLSERCVGQEPDCADDPPSDSIFYRNTGAGFEASSCAALGELITAGAADLNADGATDLVVGRIGAGVLALLNPADGTSPCSWTPIALPDNTANATALAVADFNNDGLPDLFTGSANTDGASPARWFHGDGAGGFTEVTESGPDPWTQYGRVFAAPIDIDSDGWMDLLIAAEGLSGEPGMRLWRNDLGDLGSDLRAYTFWLRDDRGTGAVYGARVEVAGQVAQRASGGSWRTSQRDVLHLGVGELAAADVLVRWPDGSENTHAGLPPGCYVLNAAGAADPC